MLYKLDNCCFIEARFENPTLPATVHYEYSNRVIISPAMYHQPCSNIRLDTSDRPRCVFWSTFSPLLNSDSSRSIWLQHSITTRTLFVFWMILKSINGNEIARIRGSRSQRLINLAQHTAPRKTYTILQRAEGRRGEEEWKLHKEARWKGQKMKRKEGKEGKGVAIKCVRTRWRSSFSSFPRRLVEGKPSSVRDEFIDDESIERLGATRWE